MILSNPISTLLLFSSHHPIIPSSLLPISLHLPSVCSAPILPHPHPKQNDVWNNFPQLFQTSFCFLLFSIIIRLVSNILCTTQKYFTTKEVSLIMKLKKYLTTLTTLSLSLAVLLPFTPPPEPKPPLGSEAEEPAPDPSKDKPGAEPQSDKKRPPKQ